MQCNGSLMSSVGIPLIGLGTFKLRANIEPDIVYNVLDAALEVGYRLIDTASCYRNEKDIGVALKKLYLKHGISRSDIYLTSKLAPKDMGYQSAIDSCSQSISDLQCEYLDFYLIHWPGRAKLKPESEKHAQYRKETWRALEELYRKGFVRNIGVSNFTIKHLDELLEYSEIKPALNQVEFHVHLQQSELLKYCQEKGIFLQSYSSLGTGVLLDDCVIVKIAEKYSCTCAQILLQWVIQQGVGVIPKSTKREHILSNYLLDGFKIDDCDLGDISKLNINRHYCWDPYQIH